LIKETALRPIAQFPQSVKKRIRYLLTDIDDTLTVTGKLPSIVFSAMEHLQKAGIRVIPITGRPAGWCDHIARMWHVDGLVGENGALYFYYRSSEKRMIRRFWKSKEERRLDREKLDHIRREVLVKVPGCAVASDQAYREADLAIDFCEDVPALPASAVNDIKAVFEASGATAKASSIHVNGWFGNYDKLAMCRLMLKEVFQENLDDIRDRVVYCGDSPNDAPMFGYFPNSVGVANVHRFESELEFLPHWVTEGEGGYGFAEMVAILLDR
jgi:HAD superfamily hydrolase (TIGR01484 family)